MELCMIFDQMTVTYGCPTPAALLKNDSLFRSVYSPQDASKVLFQCSEDCQEVQILGEDPYTPQQLLNNAVHLLLQCGLHAREFDYWDCKPAAEKIWTNLKMFIQDVHTHRLNATSLMVGFQGYTQNAFAILQESDNEDEDVQSFVTQMGALITQSNLSATTAAKSTAGVTTTIAQLAVNQQTMQQQFVAFTAQCNTSYQQPPIAGFNIPAIPALIPDQPTCGQTGGQGHGTGTSTTFTSRHNPHTPFANYMGHQGAQGGLPAISSGGGGGHGGVGPLGGIPPFALFMPNNQRNAGPMYSNIIKKCAICNVCFSCGFDVENGHSSKTCPAAWRHVNHQEGFDHTNANQYVSVGYDVCMEAMHKSQFPAS
jgi:hypothetical protein